MDFENVKAQMRKGVLEFCILSILSKNDAYATDILNKLKESELIVVEGTLYPLLIAPEKRRFVKLPVGRIQLRALPVSTMPSPKKERKY